MKKNIFITLFSICVLIFILNSKVLAQPLVMDDGKTFDATFYANTYEDVRDAFGYDTKALYKHYLTYGKYEGRLAYEGASPEIIFNYEVVGNCKNVKNMNNQIDKIPDNLKNFLSNNGWSIYLTDENLAQTEFDGKYNSVMGMTDYIDKYIKIEDREKAIQRSILHEIGHAIDWNTGEAVYSNTEEFLRIYESEKTNFSNIKWVTNHSISSATEYFAESVQQYIIRPDSLNKYCPETYLYVDKILNSL